MKYPNGWQSAPCVRFRAKIEEKKGSTIASMTTLPPSALPQELGFAMPAEWEPHAATWMTWPADDELWFGHLEAVRAEFAELVRTIARFERVELLVRDDETQQDAKQRLKDVPLTEKTGVRFHRVPSDDVWMRDNGPLFVRRGDEVALVNWKFNAWGGKFHYEQDNLVPEYISQFLGMARWDSELVLEGGGLEVNGAGVGLTTRSCFLTDTRNAGLSEDGYGVVLREMLGVNRLLWLGEGLENDHTDGHIDTITRFVGEHTIVTSTEDDKTDKNHATMTANLTELRQMTDAEGRAFEVIELPLPADYLEGAEGRLPPTYANFYIGNGFVVVPQYGDPNDEPALEILRGLFPDREVIGLSSRAIIEGGGSFHCITQQQPQGRILSAEELAKETGQ